MADTARSSDPAVQAQLDRLARLGPGADILGLDRITRLLERLDNPHVALPPVFHVAGTNGKGSTCAFLRAALEAEGYKVHVYSSPHLVRFNERIRLAGHLVEDALLADALAEVLDSGEDVSASFFEVTTAAAFLLFARVPADACVIEVGLGGRLDATNVLAAPAIGGIAALGMDHEAFLGNSLTGIAREKAGIAKPGMALAVQRYEPSVAAAVADEIGMRGGHMLVRGRDWDIALYRGTAHYRDAAGRLDLPLPLLPGPHQIDNLGLATAMLRHQQALPLSEAALRAAPRWAHWPARFQRLEQGPLLGGLSPERTVWLDGGHNPSAGEVLAAHLAALLGPDERVDLVLGMLVNKDAAGFLAPLWPHIGRLESVPVTDHAAHGWETFAALASAHGVPHRHHAGLPDALAAISDGDAPVLIGGSLYLAGTALALNDQAPA